MTTKPMMTQEVLTTAPTLLPLALKIEKATKANDAPILCARLSMTVFVNVTTFIRSIDASETIKPFTAGVWKPTPIPIRLIEMNK